jgi:uncharacterized SAM-binding protein YcdF (DUF218 family)
VAPEAVLIEESSRTTEENLEGAWDLLVPNQARSILLVSDAFHMGRALRIARDQGFDPHPAPVRSDSVSREPLDEGYYIVREAFALIGYWLTGR